MKRESEEICAVLESTRCTLYASMGIKSQSCSQVHLIKRIVRKREELYKNSVGSLLYWCIQMCVNTLGTEAIVTVHQS